MIKHRLICRENRPNKAGECAVYFLVTAHGTRSWIATGIFISALHWDKAKEAITTSCPDYRRKSSLLSRYKLNADLYLQRIDNNGQHFSQIDFVDAVKEKKTPLQDNPKIPALVDDYLLQKNLSLGRERHYQVLKGQLLKFKPNARLADIGTRFLSEFEQYLRKKGNDVNTIATKMIMLKAIVHQCQADNLIKDDPTARYKVKKKRSRRQALTKKELLQLESVYQAGSMPARLTAVLRYFLFSCYTGLRYGDIKTVKDVDIINELIMIDMHKTGEPIEIPLIQEAKALIDLQPDGRLFNVLTNEATNRYLKEISTYAGLRKQLTFHVSRHTFATTGIALGIPLKVISAILGHTSIRTTEIYLHVYNDVKREEMKKWAALRVA